MSHNAKSARVPTFNTPRSLNPKAFAALTVTPLSASSGVILNNVHAIFSINRSEHKGAVPGLKSLASAIATLCFLSKSIGGNCVSRKK